MRKALLAALLVACGDPGTGGGDDQELITTVTLTFTPMGGGTDRVGTWEDLDGDGGAPPTITSPSLVAGTTYVLAARFQNALETPPEEITDEVRDEGDQHQVFFTGTAIGGPLAHSYADTDAGGLPLGLANTVMVTAGAGDLVVTLKHLPPINDAPQKVAGLAEQAKTQGIAAVPGDTDVSVTFPIAVPTAAR